MAFCKIHILKIVDNMNYYQYKKRAPRKAGIDYIKPFIVIIIFIAIIVAGWNLLSSLLIGESEVLSNEKVFLEIETGSAKAMTDSDSSWKNVPSSIYLYEGESVKTLSDGRITLSFFDQSLARLDKSSEVSLKSLSREGVIGSIDLELSDGKLWVNVDEASGMDTDFTVDTGIINLKTSGGIMVVSYPGTIYVLEGSAEVDILHEGNVVKNVTVGVGQQLVVDDKIATDLAENLTKEILFALDDSLKTSNWYRWNRQKDGLDSIDTSLDNIKDTPLDDISNTDIKAEVDDSTAEVIEDEELEEEDFSDDTEAPSLPQIKSPGSNNDTVILDGVVQKIQGTVSDDTAAVIVNDYRLGLFKAGDGEFIYTANIDFNNLKVGENKYEIIAEDKAGNKSEAATITLELPQDIYDNAKAEKINNEDKNKTPSEASSGGVKFTSPNGGENLSTSETAFEVKGEVPEGTVKVLVNNYQLQGFSEGDTTFLYRATSTLKTLIIDELNTYTAKAYDADDKLLGTATITIDVESGSKGEGTPVITIPTTTGAYETTLNEIAIGGTVGKWITRVRIDGSNIGEYIPGSGEWKKTVILKDGENIFKICAEKAGEEQGCSSITVNYQN